MKVAFDSVILGAYLHPEAQYPKPVSRIPERLAYLIETLESERAKIIVPTPALAEFLVLADKDGDAYLSQLTNSTVFSIEPFDLRAAIEAAASEIKATAAGAKKAGATGSWQKIKVDRQIVAIAKVHQVDHLYSDDEDVQKLAEREDMDVKGARDLPLPPEDPQAELFVDE